MDYNDSKDYEVLEHTADEYIAVHGESLEEAFENAGKATTSIMTDLGKVKATEEKEANVEGHDIKALLYNWLEELLVRFDAEGMLYSRFQVEWIKKSDPGYCLKARIAGEHFDPERHPQLTGVKAVTYHMMEIIKEPNKVTLKFVLDV
ncbi:MAG: archease [Candidatus Bathyarchaeia archaeon]